MNRKQLSRFLMVAALVAVGLAGVRAFTRVDLVLASTQWLLVAIVLGIFGLYLSTTKF